MNSKLFIQNLLTFLALGAVLALSFMLIPDARGYGTHEHLFLPPCFVRFFFHIPCPACGLTTCFAYLAKGQWIEAFHLNWVSPFIFLGFLLLFIYSTLCLFSNQSFWNIFERKLIPYFSTFIIISLLLNWTVKIFTNDEYFIAVRSFF